MGTWKVDSALWPVVIHSVDGSLSNAEIDDYVRGATDVFLRSGSHVAIMDISKMGSVSAYSRSRSAAWLKQHRAQLALSCLGVAYVIPNALLRFITMTVMLVITLPMPYVVVSTRAEALLWAHQRLGSTDSAAPP